MLWLFSSAGYIGRKLLLGGLNHCRILEIGYYGNKDKILVHIANSVKKVVDNLIVPSQTGISIL